MRVPAETDFGEPPGRGGGQARRRRWSAEAAAARGGGLAWREEQVRRTRPAMAGGQDTPGALGLVKACGWKEAGQAACCVSTLGIILAPLSSLISAA